MIGNIVTVKVDRPMGMMFTKEEIREKVYFQEQYFESEIRM